MPTPPRKDIARHASVTALSFLSKALPNEQSRESRHGAIMPRQKFSRYIATWNLPEKRAVTQALK